MAEPTSLLGDARAFARDFPRDRMPQGYLWDVADFVPSLIDANLTGRGPWRWGSTEMGGDGAAGILAPFPTGDKLLVVGANNRWYEVSEMDPYTATDRGAAVPPKQNPVFFNNTVVHFDATGVNVPQLVTAPGGVVTIASAVAGVPKARYGAVKGEYVVVGGIPDEEHIVRYSVPNNLGVAFDTASFVPTSRPITGLAALRGVVLVFHAGTVDRIRGSTPPHGTEKGDLIFEPLFDRAGCQDVRSIAYWNDNVLFADEHGVHMTDGAVIRNLATQGGILSLWRPLYENRLTVVANTFLDYYQITVRKIDLTAVTLVCNLNTRQWFRFTNIEALSYIASGGGAGMERVWAGMAGTNRLARIGPCFFPVLEAAPIVDDDGTPVLPALETAWYRLGEEGRKRIRDGYLSYDARASGDVLEIAYIASPQQTSYTVMGNLPATTEYTRYRLPVRRFPYGVGFRVRQLAPSSATRIFDLGLTAWPAERHRV